MKTIKIIDLLNKIANGEEVPKEIKYDGELCSFDNEDKDYYCKQYGNIVWYLVDTSCDMNEVLETELEILDEEDEFEDIYSLCDNSEQYNFSSRQTGMTKEDRRLLDSNFKELLIVVNQLIKNQKKIIERLKNG